MTYSGVPPEVYECVDIWAGREQQVVPPLVIADVEAAVLVHPADKPAVLENSDRSRYYLKKMPDCLI